MKKETMMAKMDRVEVVVTSCHIEKMGKERAAMMVGRMGGVKELFASVSTSKNEDTCGDATEENFLGSD